MTYQYIQILSLDEIVYDLSKSMPFTKRLDLINKLAQKRNLSASLKADIKKITGVAKELAKFRNDIAHNPVLIDQSNKKEKDVVAFVGVPKWKKALDMSSVPVISANSINLGVDAVVELAKNMNKPLNELKKIGYNTFRPTLHPTAR